MVKIWGIICGFAVFRVSNAKLIARHKKRGVMKLSEYKPVETVAEGKDYTDAVVKLTGTRLIVEIDTASCIVKQSTKGKPFVTVRIPEVGVFKQTFLNWMIK